MEDRYLHLRKQLEELGYHQYLKIECVPLVEKLVCDLIQTTESLRKYMKISKDAISERDNLLLGAEPYKCDNAKLVKECNELHLAFLNFREQHEKLQKDLKRRISVLERQKIDSDLEKERLATDVKNLELVLAQRNSKLLNFESSKLGLKSSLKSSTMPSLKCKCGLKEKPTLSLAEEKIISLMKQIDKLKEEKIDLTETNLAYKDQINSRDKEIQRLVSLLEGGRPLQALNQDCCYKDVESKMTRLQDDVEILQRSKKDLESRLKEAVVKQHEAMKRALALAERNRLLEKEMRDIDQIALAVEAECNSSAKCNATKVTKLQERMHESTMQIQQLEKEVADVKRDKQELVGDYEVAKTEKRHLQSVLETALDEKKRLNDRLNHYSIIEHDLNMEIDRLVQTSAAQKQKIAELECRLLSATGSMSYEEIGMQNSGEKFRKKGKGGRSSPTKKKKPSHRGSGNNGCPNNTPESPSDWPPKGRSPTPSRSDSFRRIPPARNEIAKDSCSNPKSCIAELRRLIRDEMCNKDVCLSHLKELIGSEFDHIQSRANMSLDHLKNERDYYMKECQNLMEKMRNLCHNKPRSDTDVDCMRKLAEMEQLIATLQHENRTLSQEKHNLMTRLETARDRVDNDTEMLSTRSLTKRLERERDLLKGDIQRLEEERDGLRFRLNTMAESHLQEKARLEAMVKNSEEDVRKLEADRRDYMHTQGSRRATINNLQEECDMLREQLRSCQGELNQQRAYHTQLKTLHEQTDRALADCQGQLHQVEKEMFMVQERLKLAEKDKENATKEIINLRNDLTVLKGNMAKIDHEKDTLLHNLDDKTERIVALEEELKKREQRINSLEDSLADMRRKISDAAVGTSAKEQMLKNATIDLNRIQQDLESAIRARDMAYQENRRLQDDLASCVADNKRTQSELNIARRQVDDLKRQLQHYVAEVKRTEDLISQKEIERAEMLDHFRSLSQEATALENNNHSLETEAAETKVQLSLALDHVNDLERKIESQETMIRGYETQLSDLTSQIARMETRIVQQTATTDKLEAELESVKDLCVKLDKQKDSLIKQLEEKETSTNQIGRDIEKIRRHSAEIQNNLGKERESVEKLEQLLAASRLETAEQRILNQELQKEIKTCRDKVQELESKLSSLLAQAAGERRGVCENIACDRPRNQLKFSVAQSDLHHTLGPNHITVTKKKMSKIVEKQLASQAATPETTETTSKLSSKLPTNIKHAKKGEETSVNDSSYLSLVQISRNITNPGIVSAHEHQVLNPTIDVSSSSSSNEIALCNNVPNSIGSYSFKEVSKLPHDWSKPAVGSVSANIIGKNFDQNSDLASTLGIVSSKNRLSFSMKSQTSTGSRPGVKKRVSLTDPSMKNGSDYIPSIAVTNVSGSATSSGQSNIRDNSKEIKSISKLKVANLYEGSTIKDTDEGLSALGLVSENCGLPPIADSRSDRSVPTPAALKEVTRDDKSSQNTSCECWKICTCKNKDVHPFRTTHGQGQAITCVIANNGLVPKRYTATYSFSYDKLPSNDDSNPKT